MPIAESTIALGGIALVAAGVGAWLWLGSSGAVSQADQDKAASDAGYKAGFARGAADATAGKGALPDPAADTTAIEASKKSLSPKLYLVGFVKGYGDGFASVTIKKTTTDVTGGGGGGKTTPWKPPGPPSGLPDAMRESDTAFSYGCRRGQAKGKEDGDAGDDADPNSPLASDGSQKRQKESGDPAQYIAGYKSCYTTAWAAASAAYELEHKKTSTSDASFGELFIGSRAEGERQFLAMRRPYRPAFARAA